MKCCYVGSISPRESCMCFVFDASRGKEEECLSNDGTTITIKNSVICRVIHQIASCINIISSLLLAVR